MTNRFVRTAHTLSALVLCFGVTACGREAEPEQERVRSYLEGQITVRAEVDSIPDYSGFEVLVAFSEGEGLDTLGHAVTDSLGAFRMAVVAPDRGVYPLFISRRSTILKVDELAVAEGDSAVLNVTFPVGDRPLRIRSQENAAWMAYKNTKAQYNQSLFQLAQQQYEQEDVEQRIGQTASILWSMRENYANTIGADLAAAESILMLGGWNDSLLVVRAQEIRPENPSLVDVARAARRAQTRRAGPEAGMALLEAFMEKAEGASMKAALQSELVLAHLENGQVEEAEAAARVLTEAYPGTAWATWADHALYDFEHLMPGMEAPAFTATTYAGEPLSLDSLHGQLVLLEFYTPLDETYQRELDARNALYEIAGDTSFAIVSVSVLPDTLLNEAFFEDRHMPGHHIIAPGGLEGELARQYNVHLLPRRFLIDREGKILSKYEGDAITALQQEVTALMRQETPPS